MEKFKELSIEEMQEENGGLIPWAVYAGYVCAVAATAIVTDVIVNWDDYVDVVNKGFSEGYNAGYNK
ncbi:class IIb bacteriocin, lactobin A/cerein 7B family [Algoriphagus namhaensis]